MLSGVHELADGTLVRLRLTRPSDAPRVRAFLDEVTGASDTLVRHFTFYEPRERLTLAACVLTEHTEAIVGLAEVAMLETGIAEIGVVVGDEHQRRGLGRLLCDTVASIAARRGATHLKATMSADNRAMLALMERTGDTVRSREDEMLVAYTRLDGARGRHAA